MRTTLFEESINYFVGLQFRCRVSQQCFTSTFLPPEWIPRCQQASFNIQPSPLSHKSSISHLLTYKSKAGGGILSTCLNHFKLLNTEWISCATPGSSGVTKRHLSSWQNDASFYFWLRPSLALCLPRGEGQGESAALNQPGRTAASSLVHRTSHPHVPNVRPHSDCTPAPRLQASAGT